MVNDYEQDCTSLCCHAREGQGILTLGSSEEPLWLCRTGAGACEYSWEQGTATECLGSEGWRYMQCFLQCEFGHLYTLFNTLKEF